jgi:hypothetical protein
LVHLDAESIDVFFPRTVFYSFLAEHFTRETDPSTTDPFFPFSLLCSDILLLTDQESFDIFTLTSPFFAFFILNNDNNWPNDVCVEARTAR